MEIKVAEINAPFNKINGGNLVISRASTVKIIPPTQHKKQPG